MGMELSFETEPARQSFGMGSLEQLKTLRKRGFLKMESPISHEVFEQIACNLGSIIRREDVGLHLSGRYVHRPQAIGMHTDHASAQYLGWYCVRPEPTGGPVYLLDAHKILEERFTPKQRDLLKTVIMDSPWPKSGESCPVPFFEQTDSRWQLFYTPWRVLEIQNRRARPLWETFQQVIAQEDSGKRKYSFPVRLTEGQCLFIDNKRIFHGREALPETSQRLLKRVWIA